MSGPKSTEWQASRYDRLADPHERWAGPILDRLAPRPGERILDAGCGSGRVTRLLCERLVGPPPGSVLAVDGSAEMVRHCRQTLASYGEAVTVIVSDLLDLDLSTDAGDESWRGPVDAVFSSAVFHWIANHDELFRRAFGWLVPGGRLQAQCGGEGNVEAWSEATAEAMREPAFATYFKGWKGPWNFAGAQQTEERLGRAGFQEIRCWHEDKVTEIEDGRAYLEVVGLAAHHQRLPEEARASFTDAVLHRVSSPNTLHYVRLNIEAVRPATRVESIQRPGGP